MSSVVVTSPIAVSQNPITFIPCFSNSGTVIFANRSFRFSFFPARPDTCVIHKSFVFLLSKGHKLNEVSENNFGNRRAMNGFPTTNGTVRSSAIYRTFRNYRINKLIFIQFVLQIIESHIYHKLPEASRQRGVRHGYGFHRSPSPRQLQSLLLPRLVE